MSNASYQVLDDNISITVKKCTRAIELWVVFLIFVFITVFAITQNVTDYYRFGPSNGLIVVGICVNTIFKYLCVVLYCIINTGIRNLNNQVIHPWMTNVLYDVSIKKEHSQRFVIHEIVIASTLYYWVDWFIYINLLLSQVDMLIIEISLDIIFTSIVTYTYIT
jgi:hypothetical protein